MAPITDQRKLAILLITTHGNLDSSYSLESNENIITHDGQSFSVHKIDATRRGVCNYISDTYMDQMIKQMTQFIKSIHEEELKDDCPDDKKDDLLCFNGSDRKNTRKIIDLSKTLRSFMIKIDPVRKETKSTSKIHAKKGEFPEKDHLMFEPSDWKDKDLSDYFKNVDDTYTLTSWQDGFKYEDKLYTLDRAEKIEDAASPANNTMILLKSDGYEYLLPEFEKYLTRSYTDSENYTIRLSEIIEELKSKEYTDTIIIDLACNVGDSDIFTRSLLRGPPRGGKKTRRKRKNLSKKKKKQKRKTLRKKKNTI
tara:strand:+ start:2820 stop:3749 length:930 start_codon:yes stop_codon:yes gene_type:complete